MAQFVPGAIVTFSLGFLYVGLTSTNANSVVTIANDVLNTFNSSLSIQLIIIGICVGSGMLIHGIHWAVLGFLETHLWANHRLKPAAATFWHDFPLILQIILGPVKICIEIFLLLFCSTSIKKVAIKENVPNINKDKMEAFQFVEDFYLHFSQFYAHTSYALLLSFLFFSAFVLQTGFSLKRIALMAFLYLTSGIFFILGRIQLQSLFKAEQDIAKGKK